jgi:hypothetical protein
MGRATGALSELPTFLAQTATRYADEENVAEWKVEHIRDVEFRPNRGLARLVRYCTAAACGIANGFSSALGP